MSALSIFILGMILLSLFVYGSIKRFKIKMLAAMLEGKNYDGIIATCNETINHKLLSSKICNMYLMRAYFLKKNHEEFMKQLGNVINDESINPEEKKDLLETYLHLYLFQNDLKKAEDVLRIIDEVGDGQFKLVSHFAFDIVSNVERDDLKELEEVVEEMKGFNLGVLVYYIGMAYEQKENDTLARDYFYSSRSCFDINHYYYKDAEKHVELLSEKLA